MPSHAKLTAFKKIKKVLSKHIVFYFFSRNKSLFIKFNISKTKISKVIFYIKEKTLIAIIKINNLIKNYLLKIAI